MIWTLLRRLKRARRAGPVAPGTSPGATSLAHARDAYARGDWLAVARFAAEALPVNPRLHETRRLLAESAVRLRATQPEIAAYAEQVLAAAGQPARSHGARRGRFHLPSLRGVRPFAVAQVLVSCLLILLVTWPSIGTTVAYFTSLANLAGNNLGAATQFAPALLSAQVTASKTVLLSWAAPSPNWATGGYLVHRSTTSGGPYTAVASGGCGGTLAASARSCADVVPADGAYYYAIKGISTYGGTGVFSVERLATTPTLASTSPADNSTNFPVAGNVVLTFSEAMDTSTANVPTAWSTTGTQITSSPAITCSSLVWSVGNTVATCAHGTNLQPDTLYTIAVKTGVRDAAGSSMNYGLSDYVFTFRTYATTGGPVVLSVSPPDQSTNAGPNTTVSVTFDQTMDHASAQAAFSLKQTNGTGAPCMVSGTDGLGTPACAQAGGSFSWMANNTMVFAPTSALQPTTPYAVAENTTASNVAGINLVRPFTSSFTTAAGPDTLKPWVVPPTTPSASQTGVGVNSYVLVTFSEAMANAATQNAFTLEPCRDGSNPCGSYGEVRTAVSRSNSGSDTGTIGGAFNGQSNLNYVVKASAVSGVHPSQVQVSTDGGVTFPTTVAVGGTTPFSIGNGLTFAFSATGTTVVGNTYSFTAGPGAVSGSFTWSGTGNNVLNFRPDGGLLANWWYRVTITGEGNPNVAADLAGNPLQSDPPSTPPYGYSYAFQTGAGTVPAPTQPVVTSPSSTVVTTSTTYTIAGTSDPNALVEVWTDGGTRGAIDGADTVIASQQLQAGLSNWSMTVQLTTGANQLQVTASNSVGQRSAPRIVPTITSQDQRSTWGRVTLSPSTNGIAVSAPYSGDYNADNAGRVSFCQWSNSTTPCTPPTPTQCTYGGSSDGGNTLCQALSPTWSAGSPLRYTITGLAAGAKYSVRLDAVDPISIGTVTKSNPGSDSGTVVGQYTAAASNTYTVQVTQVTGGHPTRARYKVGAGAYSTAATVSTTTPLTLSNGLAFWFGNAPGATTAVNDTYTFTADPQPIGDTTSTVIQSRPGTDGGTVSGQYAPGSLTYTVKVTAVSGGPAHPTQVQVSTDNGATYGSPIPVNGTTPFDMPNGLTFAFDTAGTSTAINNTYTFTAAPGGIWSITKSNASSDNGAISGGYNRVTSYVVKVTAVSGLHATQAQVSTNGGATFGAAVAVSGTTPIAVGNGLSFAFGNAGTTALQVGDTYTFNAAPQTVTFQGTTSTVSGSGNSNGTPASPSVFASRAPQNGTIAIAGSGYAYASVTVNTTPPKALACAAGSPNAGKYDYTFSWDGTDGNGAYVPDGFYGYTVNSATLFMGSCLTSDQLLGNTIQVANAASIAMQPPNAAVTLTTGQYQCVTATITNSASSYVPDGAPVNFTFSLNPTVAQGNTGSYLLTGTSTSPPAPSTANSDTVVPAVVGQAAPGCVTPPANSGQATVKLDVVTAYTCTITVTAAVASQTGATATNVTGATTINDPPDAPTGLVLEPGSIRIRFKPSKRATAAGYRVLLGAKSGVYDREIDLGQETAAHIEDGIVPGTKYYVAIEAYDRLGQRSPRSAEATIVAPIEPPASIDLLPGPSAPGGTLGVTATVRDKHGFPVPGAAVHFDASAGTTLTPADVVADATGAAATQLTADDPTLTQTTVHATSGKAQGRLRVSLTPATSTPSPTAAASPTPSSSPTASPSPTVEVTPVVTATPGPSATSTSAATVVPTASSTPAGTPSPTSAPSSTSTPSPTSTPTPAPTPMTTPTPSPVPSPTPSPIPTVSATSAPATPSPSPSSGPSPSPSPATTPTATPMGP